MTAQYDLVQDYDSPDMALSIAPIWILAVVKWAHPFVFDRSTFTSGNLDAFQEVDNPLIIVSDCTNLQISSNKSSHNMTLSAVLRDNNVNYLSAIYPDDWLFAWIVPNEDKAKDIINRIRAGEECNRFDDGLKFIGRVNSIVKDISIDDSGRPTSIFNLSGTGFGEFDYRLFWEPLLATQDSLPIWYQRLGSFLNSVITGQDTSVTNDGDPGTIDVNKMIPALVRLILGQGPFQNNGSLSLDLPSGTINASPNGGIRIPSLIGQLLGLSNTTNLNYSNIMDIVVGVQKFSGNGVSIDPNIFTPNGLDTALITFGVPNRNTVELSNSSPTTAAFLKTADRLLGEFPLVQLPIQNTPVWQIMENFLNSAINEMYVCLKHDDTGHVFPRLTVRQLPFSSNKFANSAIGSQMGVAITKFLEMPRWLIDPKMLKHIQIGRSNALRSNFWHIQGVAPGTPVNDNLQYALSPPRTDKSDIERSGLRAMTKTVNCLIKDATIGPNKWRDIITDITAGQHLTLTGTIVTLGIIPPIAIGDNVEFANVVYHLEGVTHACGISPQGKRMWQTSLQISHGQADEITLAQNQSDTSLDPPLQEYAGVRNSDSASMNIGRTVFDTYEET